MKLHHIAIWTFRLEELKDFYVRFLGGTSNEKYINPKKGFESYFISFDEGPTLELMSRWPPRDSWRYSAKKHCSRRNTKTSSIRP